MFGRSVLAAVIAGLLVAPAGAEEIQKEYHETFPAQEGTRLDLRHGDGDVTVQVWDKDEVQIEVRYHASVRAVGAAKTADRALTDVECHGMLAALGHARQG